MTANGLLAAAAAAPLARIIRNRAMDTVLQREGDDPTWTVKTKNLDLIRALDEVCAQGRGIELCHTHELGVVKAAEYAVDDALLTSIMAGLDDKPTSPPAAA